MIVKAEILNIAYEGNTCTIRMPYFESAAGGDNAVATAIISNTPGIYNGYKAGDIVLVAFEDGQPQNPCVIGKLYLGAAEENKINRGAVNCTSLAVTAECSIPLTTKLFSDNTGEVKTTSAATNYKTLKELVDTVIESTNTININTNAIKLNTDTLAVLQNYSTSEQNIGTWIDGKTLYRKIIKYQGNLTLNTEIIAGTIGTAISDVASIKHTTTYTPAGKNNSAYEFYYDPADGHHTVVGCRVDKVTGDVYICSCNDSWNNTTLIIAIEYTKA